MRPNFLNKNCFRKFPLKDSSLAVFDNGAVLPDSLIAGLNMTTVYGYHELYVYSVYVANNFVSVTIGDNITGTVAGVFGGVITENYQALPFTPFVSFISGNCIIGNKDALLNLAGQNYLNYENGALEESQILCIKRPGVTSFIQHQTGDTIAGNITLAYNNISSAFDNSEINLSVVNDLLIKVNNNYSSATQCNTPFITAIQGVTPNSAGNIDFYGIDPVVFSVSGGRLGISTGSSFTLDTLCGSLNDNIPPVDTSDIYYADIPSVPPYPAEYTTWVSTNDTLALQDSVNFRELLIAEGGTDIGANGQYPNLYNYAKTLYGITGRVDFYNHRSGQNMGTGSKLYSFQGVSADLVNTYAPWTEDGIVLTANTQAIDYGNFNIDPSIGGLSVFVIWNSLGVISQNAGSTAQLFSAPGQGISNGVNGVAGGTTWVQESANYGGRRYYPSSYYNTNAGNHAWWWRATDLTIGQDGADRPTASQPSYSVNAGLYDFQTFISGDIPSLQISHLIVFPSSMNVTEAQMAAIYAAYKLYLGPDLQLP